MNKRQIINSVLRDSGYKTGDEILYYCPFCRHHKRKLSVNFSKNVWKCWICEKSGSGFLWLVRKFGTSSEVEEWSKISGEVDFSENNDLLEKLLGTEESDEPTKLSLPDSFRTLVAEDSLMTIQARNYLKQRGITDEQICYWKIGCATMGDYTNRIIVPSFDDAGHINYFVGRSFSRKAYPKYKNPVVEKQKIVFNELLINWAKPVIIVEGVFDAIVAGENSIPLLGSTLSKRSRLFKRLVEHASTVYLVLDSDARKKERRIINLLGEYGCKVFLMNVAPFADVGEMSRDEFQERFSRAAEIKEDDIMLNRIKEI